jgi:hypothetical protein
MVTPEQYKVACLEAHTPRDRALLALLQVPPPKRSNSPTSQLLDAVCQTSSSGIKQDQTRDAPQTKHVCDPTSASSTPPVFPPLIPLDDIAHGRLDTSDILRLPRFANYDRGYYC